MHYKVYDILLSFKSVLKCSNISEGLNTVIHLFLNKGILITFLNIYAASDLPFIFYCKYD